MAIYLNDIQTEAVLLEVFGFAVIALLGWLLVQLIHWDNALQTRQHVWLQNLRKTTRQLRVLRLATSKAQNLPSIPLPSSLRRKWRIANWVLAALSVSRRVRS